MVGPAAEAPGMPTELTMSGTMTGTLGTSMETTVLGTAGTVTFGATAGRACLTSRRAPTRFCNAGDSLLANNRCRSAVVSEFNSS
jgi:hypothetical protein